MLAAAKAKPDGLSYASVGSGSIGHLFMVLLQRKTGVKVTHVPYRGGGPAMNDALGGHVDFIIGSVALVTPQLGSGKLRPIVQTGEKRVPALKDVPTVMESVPDLSAYTWWGVFAPAGTPKPIVERFNKELAETIKEERVTKTLTENQQMTLVMAGPEELRKFNTAQGKLWGPVVKENDIKGEMYVPTIAASVDEAVAAIPDGAMVIVPREASGVPMEATRALIRRGVKRLHLVALPTSTLQADMLIGAGCVETLETSAVSLGEFGPAPRFTAAVLGKTIRMLDATCPAIYAGIQAAEKGVPFMPLRGLIGSDILAHRPDWRVIDNPFGNDDPIVLLPAIKPDFALIHTPMADRAGNVFFGRDREALMMAHASARTIATVEKLYDGNLMDDPALSSATVPGFYVETVALAPRGAWPLRLPDHYPADGAHLAEYAKLAATAEGFARYCEQHVYVKRAA